MASDYDTRPRDPRAPDDPYATGTPGAPLGATTRGHPVDPGRDPGSRAVYYIVGALVVAAIVLFLIFSGGSGVDQTAPTTTAPAVDGTAPATGIGTDAPPPPGGATDGAVAPPPAGEPTAPAPN